MSGPQDHDRRSSTRRQTDQTFQLLLDNVRDYAIFLVDPNGSISSWNVGVERLFGFTEAEFVGRQFSSIFTDEDVVSGAPVQEMEIARECGRSNDERWHVRKDRSRFWAHGVLTALRDDSDQLIGFAKIMRDMTLRQLAEEERKGLLEREQAAHREAVVAARMREQFLATVSHELRTPLNAILGWALLLESGNLDDAKRGLALETIVRNARIQGRLIEELLDVSRILSGTFSVELRQTNLTAIVKAAIDGITPAAGAKALSLECDAPEQPIVVFADPRRIHQIASNLLSNAVKFTPSGGHIRVSIFQHDDYAQVVVRDTGIGISPDFLPFVFEPFIQHDMSSTRAHGGLGLGLAIVKHLVTQHGGTVSVESGGVGAGSAFLLKLPLGDAAHSESVNSALPTPEPSPLASMTIMVIEDHHDTRELIVTTLEMAGADVRGVGSVTEGLDAVKHRPPTIIVCDLALAGEDGFAFMQVLQTLPNARHVPVLALTAFSSAADRLRALQAGFKMYLSKPIDPSQLVFAITKLAGAARTDRPKHDP